MSKHSEDIEIVHNEAQGRFQAEVEGKVAFLQYSETQGKMTLTHTEVPQELGGQGLGGKLVEAALQHARSTGAKVVPRCPFAASYIRKHPEHQSLVLPE